MKSYITLVLLTVLSYNASADEGNTLDFIPINVLNVTMKGNSSEIYPDIIILLPHNFSAEQRAEFMEQLAVGIVGDVVESPDNALKAVSAADVTRGVNAALLQAAPQIMSLNTTGASLSLGNENATSQIYAVIPPAEEEYIRKRRSLERLFPLKREKRTLKKHFKKGGCMICQMLQPQTPIIVNVYKQDGCGGGCGHQPQQHYQPSSCGQPQCGYHPKPQPPPVYHQPQQTCDPCRQQQSYQQPSYHQPPSNTYSYSQSSSSASSSSGSWGKKR